MVSDLGLSVWSGWLKQHQTLYSDFLLPTLWVHDLDGSVHEDLGYLERSHPLDRFSTWIDATLEVFQHHLVSDFKSMIDEGVHHSDFLNLRCHLLSRQLLLFL
ncbi:hypothetical protein LINGRAPRIM_LOCUS3400 [Linum grandiflorum]